MNNMRARDREAEAAAREGEDTAPRKKRPRTVEWEDDEARVVSAEPAAPPPPPPPPRRTHIQLKATCQFISEDRARISTTGAKSFARPSSRTPSIPSEPSSLFSFSLNPRRHRASGRRTSRRRAACKGCKTSLQGDAGAVRSNRLRRGCGRHRLVRRRSLRQSPYARPCRIPRSASTSAPSPRPAASGSSLALLPGGRFDN